MWKGKEGGRTVQREKISFNVVSTEASAVPTGTKMGDHSELFCFGKEDWAFIPLCPSVMGVWPPLGRGCDLGQGRDS